MSAANYIQDNRFNRLLCAAGAVAVVASIWFRPEPPLLYGIDAGVYARVAREMAERPLSEWFVLTWDGQPFYEHPPLEFWLESLLFRCFGASARTALTLARWWATLLAVATAVAALSLSRWRVVTADGVARRMTAGAQQHLVDVGGSVADPWRVLALSFIGLLTLSGFHFESQNPMLDLPLAASMTCAMAALFSGRRGLFVVFAVAAFWIKGPPALALLVPLLWWLGWLQKRWVQAVLLAAITLSVGTLSAVAFDALRERHDLEPFFATYLRQQVLASFTAGRHHPSHDPFFFFKPLVSWYAPGLVALLILWGRERRAPSPLLVLATLWLLAIVGGFTAATQKWEFYIHPVMPAAAWLVSLALDAGLARVGVRRVAWLPVVLLVASVVWMGMSLVVSRPSSTMRASILSVSETPAPGSGPVADCSTLGEWRARHLFAFHWRRERATCDDAAAPWTFDGKQLEAR